MKMSPIIVRIRDQVDEFSDRVAGTAEFEAATEADSLDVPHAFVLPLGEEVEPSQTAGEVTQVINEHFAVVVVVDNSVDMRGQAAADELDDLRTALFSALIGWEPVAEHSGVEFRGGVHLAITRARLWHQFDFSSLHVINQT